ncbi:amino acid permease domain-containing protein [Trichoderma breve]|uniref:Amino acid permease domain-containing protein n=1 Tax=Trichoderma breve TaxID=2034170 RepID=A0A9W9B5L6_9HYPO|nr:amino acid permease domain-containing protein [Trichoderma breve]KAJ4856855.1 amino acid permease domain-containing protein [Trichoderma breve]
MASNEPEKPKSIKNGITYTRDFEVVEMSDLSPSKSQSQFAVATSYSITTNSRPRTSRKKSMGRRFVDSFRRVPGGLPMTGNHGYHVNDDLPDMGQAGGRFYDLRAANVRTANSALARDLKGRHLQMIAIGGSVGTGLFVASGVALYQSGPASLLLGYLVTGAIQFCTMQSMGELVTAFPVAGSFSAFSSRFLDPSWGFAMGWNYALQWLVALPVEMISGALAIQYWNASLNPSIFVTIFLLAIVGINLMGIKGYGEAEFIFSTVKVTAIVGFILLGVVINIGGPPTSGYIGGHYWTDPGPTHNGFKGFCSVLATSSFSFVGTEIIGLAAAETANPRKSLPSAIKQVFWRIGIFYIVSLLLVTLLVPYNEPRLLGGQSSVDAVASPFVIAVESAGSTILPSVMNAVIMIAVLSVGNSAIFGSSRTLASLAEQSHAPAIFSYVDRKGRPLVAILFASSLGLLAYLVNVKIHSEIFDWLFAICGLSSLFTWGSICLCHIRFRRAWAAAGYSVNHLPFVSQAGVLGSILGLVGNILVLASQFWVAISPVPTSPTDQPTITARNFFLKMLAVPIVILFYIGHKLWFRTQIVSIASMDIHTGRSFSRVQSHVSAEEEELRRTWPLWKRIYRTLC